MIVKIDYFLSPNSASPTIMGKGTYGGVAAFFKIFYDGTNPTKLTNTIKALKYELEVYKKIDRSEENIKHFFVKYLASMKTTFYNLHTEFIINSNDPILLERMKKLNI